jgi:hypothetical protein
MGNSAGSETTISTNWSAAGEGGEFVTMIPVSLPNRPTIILIKKLEVAVLLLKYVRRCDFVVL